MTAALEHGVLHLAFERAADGTTRLTRREQRYPLHVTTVLRLDAAMREMAFVYVGNPSGGLFAGDRLEITVDAGAGTRVHLTTTAAAKAYAMGAGETAEQRVRIVAREGAYVEYVPQLLIPQGASSVEQHLELAVGDGAACVALEGVAPGRVARGERFAYERVALATSVTTATGELLARDAMVFEPGRRSPALAGMLGGEAYVGTVTVAAPGRAGAVARAMDDALGEAADAAGGGAAGELPLACGAVARIVAPSSPGLRRALSAAWGAARLDLLGRPLPRALP